MKFRSIGWIRSTLRDVAAAGKCVHARYCAKIQEHCYNATPAN